MGELFVPPSKIIHLVFPFIAIDVPSTSSIHLMKPPVANSSIAGGACVIAVAAAPAAMQGRGEGEEKEKEREKRGRGERERREGLAPAKRGPLYRSSFFA